MDKVDELRKQLKDAAAIERSNTDTGPDGPSVSSTSADIERYTPNELDKDGHSVQPVSRPGLGTVSVGRAVSDTQRKFTDIFGSVTPGNSSERRTNRRSRQDNSSYQSNGIDLSTSPERQAGSTEQVRKVGNLETTDAIPPRFFNPEREAAIEKSEAQGTAPARKRGRPPKQRDIGTVSADQTTEPEKRPNFFANGKILSKQEAKELLEPLTSALTDEMQQIDKLLWKYTGDELEQPIWSDVTENEMERLTSIILKLGQKSPAMATVARTAVDASDYIVAASVVGPRFVKTAEVIRDARKKRQVAHGNTHQPTAIERFRQRRKQVVEHPVQ